MADVAFPEQAPTGARRGPSAVSLTRRVFGSRAYPVALQVCFGLVFVAVLLFAFLGPPLGENNFAVVLTWKLWWPLLPLSFLLFGRLWCAVCPVGGVNALALKAPGLGRRMPGIFLRKYGAWIMASAFLAFFWVGVIRHVCCWPIETGVVLLLFAGGAVLAGLLYRGRVWCRFLCPVGVFSGLLSLTAVIGLRSGRRTCRDRCGVDRSRVLRLESARCPLFELPMAVDTNRNCNLCGECVKFCPNDSLRLTGLDPAGEMSGMKRPVTGEAVFVLALVAIAFVEVIQTTRVFPRYMKWTTENTVFTNYDVAFSVTLALLIASVVGAYVLAARLSSRRARGGGRAEGWRSAYGLLPLVMAAYLGVAVLRLGSEGVRAAQVAVNQLMFSLAPFDLPPPVRGSFYGVDPLSKGLQLGILAVGAMGALYVVRRIASGGDGTRSRSRSLPHVVLVLLLSGLFGIAFLLPSGVILH